MNLISLGFLLFAALTVLVYHMLPGRSKAPWLLLSSLFFYLCADPRCLLFLLASVAAVFFAARRMPMSRRPKALAAAALLVDLGFLAGIKLLPFSLGLAGFDADSLRILVPLGLSFYSLQAAGYLLDVYRGKTAPEESF